jgi:hypothetical protein
MSLGGRGQAPSVAGAVRMNRCQRRPIVPKVWRKGSGSAQHPADARLPAHRPTRARTRADLASTAPGPRHHSSTPSAALAITDPEQIARFDRCTVAALVAAGYTVSSAGSYAGHITTDHAARQPFPCTHRKASELRNSQSCWANEAAD